MIYVGNQKRHVPGLGDESIVSPPSTGLFASGLDISGWGFMEWGIALAALYFAWKLVGDVKGGVRKIRGASARRGRKAATRARLKEELAKL